MTRLLPLAALLALAACGEAETPVVNAGNIADETVVETEEEAAALDLSGTWSMASFDNAQVPSVYPISATFDEDAGTMTLASDCIRMRWDLNMQGQSIAPEEVPVSTCRRAMTDGERIIKQAVESSNIIAEVGGDLWMTGNRGVIKWSRG